MAEPIYVETWEVVGNSKGNLLDIAYTKAICPTAEATDVFRRSMAETHRCTLQRLLRTRKIEFEGDLIWDIILAMLIENLNGLKRWKKKEI